VESQLVQHRHSYWAPHDDEGTPWLINGVYGSGFPAASGARPGKNGLGWYEWFYGG
jgi:hypothetical protein